jgi:serine/threonine protein kinase
VVTLSDFTLAKEIGRGAFGVIHLSEDPRTQKPVAVKIISVDATDDERRLYEREVTVLASVDHYCVLSLRGYSFAGTEADPALPAIVTDYMSGGSLQEMLNQELREQAPAAWDDTRKLIVIYGTAVVM